MKKRIICSLICISLLLLPAGCGKEGSGSGSGRSGKLDSLLGRTSETGSESASDSATEQNTGQNRKDPLPEEQEAGHDILKSKWQFYKDDETGTEGALLIGYSPEGTFNVKLNTVCYEEKNLCFRFCNICINGCIRVPDFNVNYLGETDKDSEYLKHVIYSSMKDWKQSMLKAEDGKVHSVEFDYSINLMGETIDAYRLTDDLTPVYEEKIRLQFPEEYSYGILLDSSRGARADSQVLYEDDQKTIRLLGFGGFPEGTSPPKPHFYLEVHNKTSEKQVFQFAGIIVNGMYINQRKSISLEAGRTDFVDLELLDDDFDDQGIESISEMSLLLSSNVHFKEQDSDFTNTVTLCPISLSEAGEMSDRRDEGVELYHENGLRICLLKRDRQEQGEGIRFEWCFSFTNETDDFLLLQTENVIVNGEEMDSSFGNFSLYCSVAPHTTTYSGGTHDFDTVTDEPKISFDINVVNEGNDRFLFRTKAIEVKPE